MPCSIHVALAPSLQIENAVRQLEASGTVTKVMIRTMNGLRMHDTKVVTGLVVSGLDGANNIALPKVYTRDEIPATNKEIPRPDLYHKWKHLDRVLELVPPYIEDAKVGLPYRYELSQSDRT